MIHTVRKAWLVGAGALAMTLTLAGSQAFGQAQNGQPFQPAVPLADPSEVSGNRGIDRRLDRDEQTLRDLRQIVLQAKAQGNPVQVVDAGPNPAVTDLQAKVNDFEQTLQRLNGQIETLQHQLDDSRKAVDDSRATNQDLTLRVTKLEGVIQGMQMQGGAALAPGQPPGAPGQPGQGVLGQLPAGGAASADPGAEPTGDEGQAYRQARQTLDGGDYAGGARALQDYLGRYPNSARAPEANYWLGRALALQNMQADAAVAYARALRGWPQSTWAGDAVIRLSDSLVELKRTENACEALGEFDRRYAAKAAAAIKVRAREAKTRAACA